VCRGHQVVYQLQDIFNLLPDVKLTDFVRSMHIKTNDQMLVVYLSSLVRSVIALHNLIDNKVSVLLSRSNYLSFIVCFVLRHV
jgi:26S proteasome regulatory subunit N8